MPKGLLWFRMYAEFAFDPKIQSMSETLQRRYAMFLCLKCNGDIPGLTDETAACALRISLNDLLETKKMLISVGLLCNNFEVNNWDKRQYRSDSSTARVKKFRGKMLNPKRETLQKRYRNGNVTASSVSVSLSDMFISFWKEYPRKISKHNAERAFSKLNPDQELFDRIIFQLKEQKRYFGDPKYIPHPTTWLNGKRWEDDLSSLKQKSFGGYTEVEVNREEQSVDTVAAFLNHFPQDLLPIKCHFNTPAFDHMLLELFRDDEILKSKVEWHLKQYPQSDETLYRKNYLYGKYGIPEVENG